MQTRNTVQRQIVLRAVQSMHDHPTAETVYEAVAGEHPSISKATVYRNLNQLAAQGVIQRVPIPNSADRFDFNLEQHYHVRCTHCGAVYDVQMPYLSDLIDQVEDASGVLVERYEILFEGVCAACRGK
ncbi:Fur family transcriptional regulator [Agathobaculum sp.]|uniref:Fur family transcriptional regulator n=1 Tax=Agathobaculum sp. TaxID=2048138 RepID=UPI002A8370FB|nr:transcriptional repressor [Agathobaculum sp.]MDY3619368.1 transcriptional repressor [Agathobaculum sp.]